MSDLTVSELAKEAGVTRQAVHLAWQRGDFPHAKDATAHNPILIPRRDADPWIEKVKDKKRRAQAQKV